jgi:hypothetical protein
MYTQKLSEMIARFDTTNVRIVHNRNMRRRPNLKHVAGRLQTAIMAQVCYLSDNVLNTLAPSATPMVNIDQPSWCIQSLSQTRFFYTQM